MTALWTFLVAAVGPLAIRALLMLGFASVTFTGVTALAESLVSQAQSSWSSLPAALLSLASLAGLPTALGLIFGAFMARVTLWVGANSVKLLFRGLPG